MQIYKSEPPMENIDIAAISDFLLSINHAVTTITISCAGHACIFYTILAGIIDLAILTFLPLKVRKYIAERRYRQYILYIILFSLPIYLSATLVATFKPDKMCKYYMGGANTARILNPNTGIDEISSRVIAEFHTLFKEHTIFVGEQATLDKQGQEALALKTHKYIAMLNDARKVQTRFPLLYITTILASMLTLTQLPFIKNPLRQKCQLILWVAWCICAIQIYAYPIHYIVWGEKMHLPALLLAIFCVVCARRVYLQKRI